MKYSILLALFMTFANFTDYGMMAFSALLTILAVICSIEALRNILIGTAIVGGFWYFVAG